MTDATVDSSETKAARIAATIAGGFARYRQDFQAITSAAKHHFESRDWAAAHDDSSRRLAIYSDHLRSTVSQIEDQLQGGSFDHALWVQTRAAYVSLITDQYNAELFETFFNSVHRELTGDGPVNDEQMFVSTEFAVPPRLPDAPIFRVYDVGGDVVELVRRILRAFDFTISWQNLDRDVGNILRSLAEERPEIHNPRMLKVEILKSVFFRNKGAYIVGRLSYPIYSDKPAVWPFVLPLLVDDQGALYVDTLVCDEDELSVVFSFTRAYFMVHSEYPHALVDFLQSLLPRKTRSELYASIGLHKHGKTVFYRNFLDHLSRTDDQFVIAPGVKGMVMTVFTLPSLQTVFKVIKDEFAPQKDITHQQVKDKYHVVKRHDRVGRMADTQEFENLLFPRDRFSADLEAELMSVASDSVVITEEHILIKHLYTERLMTPLNLYIEAATDAQLREALDEYGNAIKQLAAANIFPGDMLLKNFGITRHGRVVFYDYDEICYLTDVNFRAIPEPRTPEEEMSADTWYTVSPADVFPEEFRRFLFGRKAIKHLFSELHGELFDPGYWQSLQGAISTGRVMDVFPYRRKKRFTNSPASPLRDAPAEG